MTRIPVLFCCKGQQHITQRCVGVRVRDRVEFRTMDRSVTCVMGLSLM